MSIFDIAHRALGHPIAYIWSQRIVGADRLRRLSLDRFAALKPGERVLDLGCGAGHVRDLMPQVDYVGFDTDQRCIDYARKRYAGRGQFHCESFAQRHVDTIAPFDAILLFGVLHHLDDATGSTLMARLSHCLKPDGRVVTLDPCFTPNQSAIARYVAERDRGHYVRTAEGYDALASGCFSRIVAETFHNVCRIPTTERIARLSEPTLEPSFPEAYPATDRPVSS